MAGAGALSVLRVVWFKLPVAKSGLLGSPCIVSPCLTQFRTKYDRFAQVLERNRQNNPRNMKEVEEMGLTKWLKKNRMYAQYNYQEWRYPQKERAIDISCSRMVFKEYQDKDALMTRLRRPRKELEEKRLDLLSHRAIKKRVPDFHRKRFPVEAQEIYLKAHELLNSKNWIIANKEETEETLHGLVTEHAYPTMLEGLDVKTVNWKFVESIEPPRTVQVICSPMMNEENLYGQVTVRFHTRQILAIYDRFGRLMIGSPDEPRDILEYVTFERHIVDQYGKWRIHAKKLADPKNIDALEKTIAVIKKKPQRAESEEWHKEEEEIHTHKWYPSRERLIRMKKWTYWPPKNKRYWARRRKWWILNAVLPRKLRIKRKHLRLVAQKSKRVYEMRQRGELPKPPS